MPFESQIRCTLTKIFVTTENTIKKGHISVEVNLLGEDGNKSDYEEETNAKIEEFHVREYCVKEYHVREYCEDEFHTRENQNLKNKNTLS